MSLNEVLVYLGLGGNFSNSAQAISTALEILEQSEGIHSLESSPAYQTTAVSPIPQADYTNLVCRFRCSLSPHSLLCLSESIERQIGQPQKAKEAPRLLDIDILFYGDRWISENLLKIPHPHWQQRVFVLQPLLDLVETLQVPVAPNQVKTFHIPSMLEAFTEACTT